jgi:hypothetical protein
MTNRHQDKWLARWRLVQWSVRMASPDSHVASSLNAAVSTSLADRLDDLGGIEAARVRSSPPPGTATLADLIRLQA